MKRILITGASGFIGRNLFERLSERSDFEVWGTYNTRKFSDSPRLIKADLTQKETVKDITKGFDVMIHAASVTSGAKDIRERPYIHVTDSMIMNTLLLEACYTNAIPQGVFLSCTILYPMNREQPVKEEDFDHSQIHPIYLGGAMMKVALETLTKFYTNLKKTKFTVVRHSNMYGPHDKYDLEKSHMFGANVTKVMTAPEGGTITVWGEGREKRDLLYIADLVDFVELVIDKQNWDHEIFNVGLSEAYPVRDVIAKIVEASGKNIKLEFDSSKPTLPVSVSLDISKAKSIVGWVPKITLGEGIKKTLAWYASNIKKP